LPLELLNAYDLIVMADSEESLREKTAQLKSRLGAKGLENKYRKSKVMLYSCSMKDRWKR